MKRQSQAVIWLMIFMLVAQPFIVYDVVNAEWGSSSDTTVTDSVYGMSVTDAVYAAALAPVQLSHVTMYYLDEDGTTEVDVISPEAKNRLSLGENVKLSYTWELPEVDGEHGVKDGDFFEFYLPAELRLFNDIENEPLIFNSDTIGTFHVTAGTNLVRMTFNDHVENHSLVRGILEIWSIIREDLQSETSEVEIRFPTVGAGVVIPVKLQPHGGSIITKAGFPNNAYNGNEISWTVDINTGLEQLRETELSDPIQQGLELDVNSIEVYQLNVALNGTVTEGALLTPGQDYTITPNTNTELLELDFGDIDSAYRIKFTTTITAEWDGQRSFSNTANLSAQGVNQPATASVNVRRGEPLNKRHDGYNDKDQIITWEIQYNYNGRFIPQASARLIDEFSTANNLAMALVENSFEVFEVTLDANGQEASATPVTAGFTITPVQDGDGHDTGFTLQFESDIINTPYKIRYQTQVTGKVFDDQNVTNRVSMDGGDTWRTATRRITQGILIKENRGTNYAEKTTRWRVTFNGNHFTMENAILRDLFPNDGLELIPETVTVNSQAIADTAHILAPVNGDYKNGFTITFTGNVTELYTIEYTTAFEPLERQNQSQSFSNRATIEWDEGTLEYSKDGVSTFNPNAFVQNNGLKYGEYNAVTKEITWYIGVNYNQNSIPQVIVEDTITAGQLLLPDSIHVREMVILPNGNRPNPEAGAVVPDSEYDLTLLPIGEVNANGFEVNLGSISTPYWVIFKTSLEGQLVENTYSNTATYHDVDGSTRTLTGTVSVQHGTEYVEKEGRTQANPRFLDWTIWINRGQSQVPAGAKIIDTPSTNQFLLEDSFKVFGTSVSPSGVVSKDPDHELTRDVDYTLELMEDDEGHQSFELVLNEAFEEAYVLEYQSFLYNARPGSNAVTNEVTFEAEGISSGQRTTSNSFNVQISGGSGTGSGVVGSIAIQKVDKDNDQPLEGAVFSLYFASNQRYIATKTTDSDGRILFEDLLFTNYILIEDEAPTDYLIDEEEHRISLTSNNGDVALAITNTHENSDSLLGRLGDYVWVDTNRNGLQDEPTSNGVNGVKVELYQVTGPDQYDKIAETETADKEGQPGYYLFDRLREGQYVVCFQLPTGYAFTDPMQGDGSAHDSDANPGAGPADGDLLIGCSEEVFLAAGQENLTLDAGLVLGRIGDYLWLDSNRNGIQDEPDHNGVNGVVVELYKQNANGDMDAYRVTETADKEDKPGYYLFEGLLAGTYQVCFNLPDQYAFTQSLQGDDTGRDSDAAAGAGPANGNQQLGCSDLIVLEAGGEDLTIDAGLVLGRIGDYVWLDSNRNGIQDESDRNGFNGVTVELYKEDAQGEYEKIAEVVTAEKEGSPGYYLFNDLLPGSYQVCFYLPNGYQFTRVLAGDNTARDSDAQPGAGPADGDRTVGCSDVIILSPGEENLTIDAGIYRISSGGGYTPPREPEGDDQDEPSNPPDEKKPEQEGNEPDEADGTDETDGSNGSGSDSESERDESSGQQGEASEGSNNEGAAQQGNQHQGNQQGNQQGLLPQTGETAPYAIWIGLLLCSIALTSIVVRNRRKRIPQEI